jgi:4-hydroxy-3-polyprenylbenzoate decarboxylase
MRIIVGISGASGVELGLVLLRALRDHADCETHLVITESARITWALESPTSQDELFAAADVVHDNRNLAASISSGSFETAGMVILPCSMKTLAAIAHGYSAGLVVRAADVCLKEGRKLVLCPREMPLGKVHLKNMLAAADLGCVIMPPMLTFYNQAQGMQSTLGEQAQHLVGKILMQFGLRHEGFRPWNGAEPGGYDG